MLNSIVGQNERWAQLAALQSPPTLQPSSGSGLDFSNLGTTAANPSAISPISGGTASPLSNDTSFALLLFGGQTSPAVGTGAVAQTTGPLGNTAVPPDETALDLQLQTDLQSLLSSLTGNPPSVGSTNTSGATSPNGATPPTGSTSTGSAPTGSAPTGSAPTGSAPTGSASGTDGSLSQDLSGIASDIGTIVASLGATQQPPAGTSSGQQGSGADITNTGTASAEPAWRGGWEGTSGSGAGWLQQFALAAYSSTDQSGLTNSTSSALQSITV